MRIAAAICWYDEPIDFINRSIDTLAQVTDTIVALDGAWEGHAHKSVASPKRQRDALVAAIKRNNLRGIIYDAPTKPWGSQCAKRTAMYREASKYCDWILVHDMDEEIVLTDTTADNIVTRLTQFDAAGVLVGKVMSRTIRYSPTGIGGRDYATSPAIDVSKCRFFKADPTMHVGDKCHYTVTTDTHIYRIGDGRDKSRTDGKLMSPAAPVYGVNSINHTHTRGKQRLADKLEYGKNRAERDYD